MTSSSNLRLEWIPRIQLWPTINFFSDERRSITWRNPTAAVIFISALLWCSFFTSSYRMGTARKLHLIKCSSQIRTFHLYILVSNSEPSGLCIRCHNTKHQWHKTLCSTFSFLFTFRFTYDMNLNFRKHCQAKDRTIPPLEENKQKRICSSNFRNVFDMNI